MVTDNKPLFTTIPTDSTGTFSLKGVDFTGNAKLMVNTLGNKKRFQGIILLDSIRYSPAKVRLSTIQKRVLKKDVFGKVIQEALINESIKKKYRLSDTIQLEEIKVFADRPDDTSEPNVITSRHVYGKPDYEIKITSSLESYRSIADVIRGRVPVFILGDEIYIRGISTFGSNNAPLYLLDGVASRADIVNDLPLTIIDRIDVLTSASQTSRFGMRGSNGVISIITKSGIKATPDEPSKYSYTTMISGYNAPRVFYSPQYAKDEMYTPDLRKTLYWQPNIKLDKNKNFPLNFFNADNASTIKILVEGITTYGIPIVGKAEYKVK